MIRNRLHSCLVLLSSYEITLRPYVAPTHTHEPFVAAKQRVYMSATLGGESDLQRAYGIQKLAIVRAQGAQWGKRYVFIPQLYTDRGTSVQILASVWDRMKTRRAVILAPSDRAMNGAFQILSREMSPVPMRMLAADITDTLDGFTSASDVMLTLAGRYDGLDLPDEQCRLLLLVGSPAATNSLERHLSDRWKMGPVLRGRERTRLIQGMGRATRNAADFAVIFWLGQALVNASTNRDLLAGMPGELSAEIRWGAQQSQLAEEGHGPLVEMVLTLLDDPSYREAANAQIASMSKTHDHQVLPDYEQTGAQEVRFSRAMWDEDYQDALQTAREIADHLHSPALAGYRAWWLYLASVAAALLNQPKSATDSLSRAANCKVNTGWLKKIIQQRQLTVGPEGTATATVSNSEGAWDTISKWGWAGPAFAQKLRDMGALLQATDHKRFHEGCDLLGSALGAKVTRTTEGGAPDVVWSFEGDEHLTIEAKTEKDSEEISKRDALEARGHGDWVRSKLCSGNSSASIRTLIVAPSPKLHTLAGPFVSGLWYVASGELIALAKTVAETLPGLRTRFAGRDFAEAADEFAHELRKGGLDLESIKNRLLKHPLAGSAGA
jgi:hypothetical protein